MAQPQVGPAAMYGGRQIFRDECNFLFEKQWIFAGLANEIATHNDFIRICVFGRDVVIQNSHGHLGAFINSCSHRHSQLQTEPRGNRPLTCPYHGWAYDARGVPVGIPRKEEFPEVCANPERFRLRTVALSRAGAFLFVRLVNYGPDLRLFLGQAFEFLTDLSEGLDRRVDEQRSTVMANWKIVIENSLEGYHVPLVHRNSLGAIAQLSRENKAAVDYLPATGHSFMHHSTNPEWLRRWSTHQTDIGIWPFSFHYYVHQLIFPILTVTSFLGYSFHIQCFYPEAVDRTLVHSRIYSSKFSGQTPRGAKIMEAMLRENIDFTRVIFNEDRQACERAHLGSLQAESPSVLAENLEQRIADFRTTYRRLLLDGHAYPQTEITEAC